MKPYKVKMLELLDEVDKICKDNGLNYILSDKTAARAEQNGTFLTDPYIFNIMMDIPDCLKFKEIVERGDFPDRAIESYENSDTIKIFSFRYVNTKTLIIDYKRNVVHKYPCVAITIKPLRYKKSGFFMKNLERMLTDAHIRSRYIIKTLTHKWVYNYVIKLNREKGNGKLYYYNMEKQYREFSSDTLTNTKLIKLNDKKLPVTKELIAYEIAYYGEDWQRYVEKPYPTVNVLQVMDDVDISFPEFEQLLKDKGLPTAEKIVKDRYALKMKRKFVYEPAKRIARNEYLVAKRSVMRFDLYQYYYPLMDELRSLISDNKIEEFEKLFMPYLYQTEYFKNHELGFYITDELYTLARKYWKATSRRIYAGEVEELIPQSLKDKDVAAVYSKYNPQPYDEEKWNTLKKMVEDKYMEKELFVLDDDSRVETEE
jgi:hypothetical protein